MAETVHLFLKANGTAIAGQSTQTSLGRADSIECVYFEHEIDTARDTANGMATGRRTYQPLVVRKRIDKSSPLIAKALTTNQVVDGTFKFYRPNPAGDGTTQQFYSVDIKGGRIAGIKQYVPDVTVDENGAEHPLEEISFTFATIVWTWVDGGISAEDTWSNNA